MKKLPWDYPSFQNVLEKGNFARKIVWSERYLLPNRKMIKCESCYMSDVKMPLNFTSRDPVAQRVATGAVYHSRDFEFEPHLGQHSLQHLTKVSVTSLIRLPPIGLQSMWKSSQLLVNIVGLKTCVRKPGNTRVCQLATVKRLKMC